MPTGKMNGWKWSAAHCDAQYWIVGALRAYSILLLSCYLCTYTCRIIYILTFTYSTHAPTYYTCACYVLKVRRMTHVHSSSQLWSGERKRTVSLGKEQAERVAASSRGEDSLRVRTEGLLAAPPRLALQLRFLQHFASDLEHNHPACAPANTNGLI